MAGGFALIFGMFFDLSLAGGLISIIGWSNFTNPTAIGLMTTCLVSANSTEGAFPLMIALLMTGTGTGAGTGTGTGGVVVTVIEACRT